MSPMAKRGEGIQEPPKAHKPRRSTKAGTILGVPVFGSSACLCPAFLVAFPLLLVSNHRDGGGYVSDALEGDVLGM
jgi:hypothetical protein